MAMLDTSAMDLPAIPGKRYFTIGEVSKLCDIKPHVLRYWGDEFDQLNPVRRGNRRYYQRHEIKLVRTIRRLLYAEGFTISGANVKLASSDGTEAEISSNNVTVSADIKKTLAQIIKELDEVVSMLR